MRGDFFVEKCRVNLSSLKCGGGEIRTLGTVSRTLVFETSAFNHSATPPFSLIILTHKARFEHFQKYATMTTHAVLLAV